MPGTANGRGPGKWGCIMIALRSALGGRLEDRLDRPERAAKGSRRPWDRPELFLIPAAGEARRWRAWLVRDDDKRDRIDSSNGLRQICQNRQPQWSTCATWS